MDFWETWNLSYLLRWRLCFRWSDVYFLWVRKRRISWIFWRHEFLKFEICRNDWLLIEFIKIMKSVSVICWDEWFNSGVLDAHFYECGKRQFLWFSGDKKFSALDFWKKSQAFYKHVGTFQVDHRNTAFACMDAMFVEKQTDVTKHFIFGSYVLHTDPKSEALLSVSQYVWGREDTWQISESFYNLAGRLGSSNSKLFRRPLLLSACCCRCVLNCSRFLCVGKFWKAFHRKLTVFVQGKLCSISKLLCAVYDLSFISEINYTALPCLVISFRCCWVEFPRRYRSCLLAQGNISRLAWC